MSVFVDTNILLRSIEVSDRLHEHAVRALTALIGAGETLVIPPQIVAEFWNVATRPRERNGIGLTPELASAELAQIESFFTVVGESADIYEKWKDLVRIHSVRGVQAHDARLVAAMKVYGISRILTFNGGDFNRYSEIEVLRPDAVLT
jgi:predicted nucleic acid-binding protein